MGGVELVSRMSTIAKALTSLPAHSFSSWKAESFSNPRDGGGIPCNLKD
jgi:hypothetical protein